MPWTALYEGEIVCPYQVPANATVECPACEGAMRVRSEHQRKGDLIPRVFVHDDASSCEGESRAHQKLKSIAAHTLEQWLPEAEVVIEQGIPGTDRFGDVVGTLPESVRPANPSRSAPPQKLGKGIVIEAQVAHKDKDKYSVTREYLESGYSVYWTYLDDIQGGKHLTLDDSRIHRVWPESVPEPNPREHYHEIHEARHLYGPGGDAPPQKFEIVLPPEYCYVHGHDLASPRGDTRYNELDTVWLSNGSQQSWVGVLHESGMELILEWWRKFDDRTELLGNVPIVSATDIQTIRGISQGAKQVEDGNLLTDKETNRDWFPVVEGELEGTDLVTSGLTYGYADGRPLLRVWREGPGGNQRHLRIGWGDDIREGLEDLANALTEAIEYLKSSGTAY